MALLGRRGYPPVSVFLLLRTEHGGRINNLQDGTTALRLRGVYFWLLNLTSRRGVLQCGASRLLSAVVPRYCQW
jgi:hypothetical protein